MFQDVRYQLFAESAAAEVTFGLSRRAAGAVDTGAVLRELALDGVADRHPATLSGGQKQRLAIATCVAAMKRVLVFDEPTSGIDLDGMRRVARLLRRLAARGRAVLVITHDLELIACACDRVPHVEDSPHVEPDSRPSRAPRSGLSSEPRRSGPADSTDAVCREAAAAATGGRSQCASVRS